MKPGIVDILRAHLMAASLTAMGAEVVVCVAVLVLPLPQDAFASAQFRLLALATIVGGVMVMRGVAHSAFRRALREHLVTSDCEVGYPRVQPFVIDAACPRRWLVILHFRFTGRAFVLVGH